MNTGIEIEFLFRDLKGSLGYSNIVTMKQLRNEKLNVFLFFYSCSMIVPSDKTNMNENILHE